MEFKELGNAFFQLAVQIRVSVWMFVFFLVNSVLSYFTIITERKHSTRESICLLFLNRRHLNQVSGNRSPVMEEGARGRWQWPKYARNTTVPLCVEQHSPPLVYVSLI